MISSLSPDLCLQHCADCGAIQAFGRDFCLGCLGEAVTWQPVLGTGRVISSTLQHRAPVPEWKDRVPYAVLLVDLDEGPRVMALGAEDFAPGTPVRLVRGGRHELPFFEMSLT